jgi:hypothetical protein
MAAISKTLAAIRTGEGCEVSYVLNSVSLIIVFRLAHTVWLDTRAGMMIASTDRIDRANWVERI